MIKQKKTDMKFFISCYACKSLFLSVLLSSHA